MLPLRAHDPQRERWLRIVTAPYLKALPGGQLGQARDKDGPGQLAKVALDGCSDVGELADEDRPFAVGDAPVVSAGFDRDAHRLAV